MGPATPPFANPNFVPGNRAPFLRVDRELPIPPRTASADIPQRRHSPFARPASAGVYQPDRFRHPTPSPRMLSPWSNASDRLPLSQASAPVPLRHFNLSRAEIPTFNGLVQEDASSWIDDLRLLVVQHHLSGDDICTLFPLCLRGNETKRMFESLANDIILNQIGHYFRPLGSQLTPPWSLESLKLPSCRISVISELMSMLYARSQMIKMAIVCGSW